MKPGGVDQVAKGQGKSLRFKEFQEVNDLRCKTSFHGSDGWPVPMWCLAIAGEAGELCNLVKKVERGDFTLESVRQQVLEEVADVITYCDLLMTQLGADTAEEVARKFNIVSERIGSAVRL